MAQTETAGRPRKERTDNAAKRRRQLIDAALRSVVRHGLARTTLATVAEEAGLSQGVAVFYFKTKEALLVAALKSLYDEYQSVSQDALAAASDDPVSQLAALVRADFDPRVCNADALAVWHAFWGEANARPIYAQVATEGDEVRQAAMVKACAALLTAGGRGTADAAIIATIIDALIDGLWLQIYLTNAEVDLIEVQAIVTRALICHFPEAETALRAKLGKTP